MATARPLYSLPKDLTRCGICNDIIHEPKALSCLHTFCLECLREWSKQSRESVICPFATCKKTTPMPSDGVKGLPGNVLVSSLIDRSLHRGKSVPCVCCKDTNNKVLARCFDCKGFLCKRGVDFHQDLLLKSHQVIMLDDIKSGKVDLKKLVDTNPPSCKEHEGQQLWLYCETCGVLICRDCTVIDHQKPDHNYVTLKSIATEQRSKIERLLEESKGIDTKITAALNDTAEIKKKWVTNKVIAEIDKEIVKTKKHIDKICEAERKRLLNQHDEVALQSEESITAANETLQKQKIQSQTAREIAIQALYSGSDHDIASVYSQLSSSLQELCKIQPMSISRDFAELSKFTADSKFSSITSIGTLPVPQASGAPSVETITVPRVLSGKWILESDIGAMHVQGISTTPTGDIAMTYCSFNTPIKVFSDGNFKITIDKKSSYAWDVVVNSTGQFYLSCRGGDFSRDVIRKFGSDGRYLSQFTAISPGGVASNAENTALMGLAINHKNQLLIGEVMKRYISIHNLNGVHVTSFTVSISPNYIATTSNDDIIVSPFAYSGVQILDDRGTLKHTINAPENRSNWWPAGVCCSINDKIFICNYDQPCGIYCFTSTGEYQGCITKDVQRPTGVTLLENDQKIAVADNSDCVKIFRRE